MSDDVAFLREQARRCRRLARGIATPDVAETLNQMASDYDARAEQMEKRSCPPHAKHGEGDQAQPGGGVASEE
jgi:hypothetical protein